MKIFIVLAALVISAFAEPAIYLKETFEDGGKVLHLAPVVISE
jgi:hypothetical protein